MSEKIIVNVTPMLTTKEMIEKIKENKEKKAKEAPKNK